jgi:hypothetical protein
MLRFINVGMQEGRPLGDGAGGCCRGEFDLQLTDEMVRQSKNNAAPTALLDKEGATKQNQLRRRGKSRNALRLVTPKQDEASS